MEVFFGIVVFLILAAVIIGVALIPFLIAKKRNHAYQWIILVLCLAAPLGGISWAIAIIWALWPQEKSLLDPIAGNVTGTGTRNVGHTAGEVRAAAAPPTNKLDELKKLGDLKASGAITEEEFNTLKAGLL